MNGLIVWDIAPPPISQMQFEVVFLLYHHRPLSLLQQSHAFMTTRHSYCNWFLVGLLRCLEWTVYLLSGFRSHDHTEVILHAFYGLQIKLHILLRWHSCFCRSWMYLTLHKIIALRWGPWGYTAYAPLQSSSVHLSQLLKSTWIFTPS